MDGRWYAAVGAGFAAVGLVVSLAGAADGSVGAVKVKPLTKSQVTKIAKVQAGKAITLRAPGLTVARAQTAAPTGAAGGDLTGMYPNPQVASGAITTDRIGEAAVTESKVASGAIVTSRLADAAVTQSKLANGAVTAASLADLAVTQEKLGPYAVAARNLSEGAVHAGALGGTTLVSANSQSVLAGQTGTSNVACPAGSRLINGGGVASDATLHLVSSYPLSANSWRVTYQNTGGGTAFIGAVATCLDPLGG